MAVTVRIAPRVATLRPLRQHIALDAPLRARSLTTPEGELAVIGSATTSTDEQAVAIIGAGPAFVIEASGPPGAALARVTSLVDELGTGLGLARRRWFRYAPPAGWYGFRREGVTIWLAPVHPRVPGVLQVFDARPFLGGDAEIFEQCLSLAMPSGFALTDEGTATTMRSPHGLEGEVRTVAGTRDGQSVMRLAVMAGDSQYRYCAHFEGAATLADEVRRVFESFEPLPVAAVKGTELIL